LPRTLNASDRKAWAQRFARALGAIGAPTKTARVERLVEGIGRVRAGLCGDQPYIDPPTGLPVGNGPDFVVLKHKPSVSGMYPILSGRSGLRPSTAFDFGEGCWEAGVPWASGLVSLAWAEDYVPHLIGTIGRSIAMAADNPREKMNLSSMLPGFAALIDNGFCRADNDARLQWNPIQHRVIRNAWAA